jgi:hypothetical protein
MPITNKANCLKCQKLIYINKTGFCTPCRMVNCADCKKRFRKDYVSAVDRCFNCKKKRGSE